MRSTFRLPLDGSLGLKVKCSMPDNTEEIHSLFQRVEQRFMAWLLNKPTGKFSVEIPVNQGGIRERPDVGIKEKV